MTATRLDWSDFYLICFAVGFCFSFFSFVFGGSRFGKLHLPHFHGHATPHVPVAGAPHAAAAAQGATPTQMAGAARAARGSGVSPFNPPSLAAFLVWFGGTGYLLTRFSSVWVGLGLIASVISGVVGGSVIFLFLSRVLISQDENMDPADYEMVGVLGKLSVPIRAGGTGELLYSQMGTRRVCGARAEDGSAIAKGTEVVVTRYEKGIAYVRLWSELSGEDELPADSSMKL
jgi:membrane protein implicated in regulation of membrane protease activity